MKAREEISSFFEISLAKFETNRMYPHRYGKDSTMNKPRHEHIAAVTRTQNLLETAVNVNDEPKLAQRIGKDIELLSQVRSILYQCIENPTLPFSGEPLLDPIDTSPNDAH